MFFGNNDFNLRSLYLNYKFSKYRNKKSKNILSIIYTSNMSNSTDKANKYKAKYLNLKNIVGGHHDPTFNEDLANLVFVADDTVLGDDAKAIILALVAEFDRLTMCGALKFNLELCHPYDSAVILDTSKYESCSIVLKYHDVPVCITSGTISHNLIEQEQTLGSYSTNVTKQELSCELTRGLVRFALKKKHKCSHVDSERHKYTFDYCHIEVVRAQVKNSLSEIPSQLYEDSKATHELEKKTSEGLSATQQQILTQQALSGALNVSDPSRISSVVQAVNNTNEQAKTGAILASIEKTSTKMLSTTPSQQSVNAAEVVAESIKSTNAAPGMTAVLVPGPEAIPISSESSVQGRMTSRGTQISNANTLGNTNIVPNAPSIKVDSTVALVPASNIGSNSIVTSNSNNGSASQNVLSTQSQSQSQSYGGATVNTTYQSTTTKVSVVPVSKSLSVAVPTSNVTDANMAASSVLTPTNEGKATKTLSTGKISSSNDSSMSNLVSKGVNEISAATTGLLATLGLSSGSQSQSQTQTKLPSHLTSAQLQQQQMTNLRGPSMSSYVTSTPTPSQSASMGLESQLTPSQKQALIQQQMALNRKSQLQSQSQSQSQYQLQSQLQSQSANVPMSAAAQQRALLQSQQANAQRTINSNGLASRLASINNSNVNSDYNSIASKVANQQRTLASQQQRIAQNQSMLASTLNSASNSNSYTKLSQQLNSQKQANSSYSRNIGSIGPDTSDGMPDMRDIDSISYTNRSANRLNSQMPNLSTSRY
jgi:hypothetical protein